jgi:acyl-CoA synthetase (AMP-forming)/AMP-acid ligase II
MAEEILLTADYTIPRALKERIQLIPDQLAQVDSKGKMTYGELGVAVDKLASGLLDLGIKQGEKVALIVPSCNTFPVAMYGIIQTGGVSVGVNPTLRPNEFKHILNDSEAVAVIVAEKMHGVSPLEIIREMRADLPHLHHVIVDGGAEGSEIALKDLMDEAKARADYPKLDPNDLVALIYTSGTTGLPKGSMHSHYTMLYPLIADRLSSPGLMGLLRIIRRYGFSYFGNMMKNYANPLKILTSLPPYTAGGVVITINFFLQGRITAHLERYTPSAALKLIEEEQVTFLQLTPATAMLFMRHPDVEKADLSSLIYLSLGTSTVPPSLVDEITDRLGVPVMIGYGATEIVGAPLVTEPFNDPPYAIRETVGKAKEGYDTKIVDENRQPLGTGEVGELAIKGGVSMLGYYKAEEMTKSVFDEDGWYFTGDLATMDKDGYIRIVGRKKDMIIRGGQNIYPAELEALMTTHPEIASAAVIGVPDALAGEKVLAYVILEEGAELSTVDMLNFCRENLAAYKVPANVKFVKEFPMNATGKVLKRDLREEAIKEA